MVNDAGLKGGSAFYAAVRQTADEAQRERQTAVSFGIRSYSDPRWCAPALVEQWTQAWLAMHHGRIGKAQFDRVDALFWSLMTEALSPEEIIDATNQSSPKLFLNYRRDDSAGHARSIHGALVRHFGAERIFFDVNSIVAGDLFKDALTVSLRECNVFIATVGPRWLQLLNEKLNKGEHDYVLMEIETALRLKIPVVPLFLSQGGKMHEIPSAEEVPPSIAPLFSHNLHVVSHERFDRDIEDLVAAIKKQLVERASSRWMHARPKQDLGLHRLSPTAKTAHVQQTATGAMDIALRVNKALKTFTAIDEDVFKRSWRRALGISQIDFAKHQHDLSLVADELQVLEQVAFERGGKTYAIVGTYSDRLRTAALLLHDICGNLASKAAGSAGFSWSEYNMRLAEYDKAQEAYSVLGADMNRFYRDAPIIGKQERHGREDLARKPP
jgi:hypothetical protein